MKIMLKAGVFMMLALLLSFFAGCGGNNALVKENNGSEELEVRKELSWHNVPHSFSGQRFEGIFALDDSHVWAVSVNGTILFFNGTSWVAQMLDNRECLFYAVVALSPNCVWAAGDDGQNGIIYYSGGSAWSKQYVSQGNRLQDIFALDSGHVWAVGQNGTIIFFNGNNWTKQASNTTEFLSGIFALDSNNAWAVGDKGTILYYNGATWGQQPILTNGTLSGVTAADPNHVWVSGYQGTVLFYDGANWQVVNSGIYGDWIKDLASIDNIHVWGVGGKGTIIFFDGATWRTQKSGTANFVADVCAVSESSVWAVGDNSTILKYGE